MPAELDPSWEYWAPADPEIEWVIGAAAAHGADRLAKAPWLDPADGFRCGRPDKGAYRLARAKAGPAGRPPAPLVTCPRCGKLDRLGGRTVCRDCRGKRTVRPRVVVACGRCGTPFVQRRPGQLFCSRACGLGRAPLADRTCPTCGVTFHPREAVTVYCSKACDAVARVVTRTFRCKWCDAPFTPRRPDRVYCSKSCSATAHHAARRAQ
jgi:hypothetical protein